MKQVVRVLLGSTMCVAIVLLTTGVVSWFWRDVGIFPTVLFGIGSLCLLATFLAEGYDDHVFLVFSACLYAFAVLYSAVRQGVWLEGLMIALGSATIALCAWGRYSMVVAEKNQVIRELQQTIETLQRRE